jgi:Flp pilus assembly protein protease CpaA
MHGVLTGGMLLWAAAIAVSDLRDRKVPNLLTLPALLLGLAWMALSGHCMTGVDWVSGVGAGAFGLAATLPAYAARKLGAGDAKYLLAIGVLGGWPVARDAFVIAALAGLALGLCWWLNLHSPMANTLFKPVSSLLRPFVQGRGKSADQLYMPFGTLLSIGFCAALLNR